MSTAYLATLAITAITAITAIASIGLCAGARGEIPRRLPQR